MESRYRAPRRGFLSHRMGFVSKKGRIWYRNGPVRETLDRHELPYEFLQSVFTVVLLEPDSRIWFRALDKFKFLPPLVGKDGRPLWLLGMPTSLGEQKAIARSCSVHSGTFFGNERIFERFRRSCSRGLSKGKNSAVELAFQAAKSAHGSAQVQAGGPFPHAGETIQRGIREPNGRK